VTSGPPPAWRTITKRTLDLFGRWGDSRTMLRSMLDSVIPVAIVDRFRDDDEGSIFGIRAFTVGGPANQFPSVSFGSAVNDWELLGITSFGTFRNGRMGSGLYDAHIFTPIDPYNPAATPAPAAVFPSGLLTNRSFTFGTVRGLAGYNAALPPIFGPSIAGPFFSDSPNQWVSFLETMGKFQTIPVPLRIYRDVTLTIQYHGFLGVGANPMEIDTSIIYRERPKVSVGGA